MMNKEWLVNDHSFYFLRSQKAPILFGGDNGVPGKS
jgi:hypothetical protein